MPHGFRPSLSVLVRFPTDVAIPVETAPGQIAQVDFGYAGKRYDPERSEPGVR